MPSSYVERLDRLLKQFPCGSAASFLLTGMRRLLAEADSEIGLLEDQINTMSAEGIEAQERIEADEEQERPPSDGMLFGPRGE